MHVIPIFCYTVVHVIYSECSYQSAHAITTCMYNVLMICQYKKLQVLQTWELCVNCVSVTNERFIFAD